MTSKPLIFAEYLNSMQFHLVKSNKFDDRVNGIVSFNATANSISRENGKMAKLPIFKFIFGFAALSLS